MPSTPVSGSSDLQFPRSFDPKSHITIKHAKDYEFRLQELPPSPKDPRAFKVSGKDGGKLLEASGNALKQCVIEHYGPPI